MLLRSFGEIHSIYVDLIGRLLPFNRFMLRALDVPGKLNTDFPTRPVALSCRDFAKVNDVPHLLQWLYHLNPRDRVQRYKTSAMP